MVEHLKVMAALSVEPAYASLSVEPPKGSLCREFGRLTLRPFLLALLLLLPSASSSAFP